MASQAPKDDPKHNPETAPDPDEDDLDDLDEMLDEFQNTKISSSSKPASSSTTAPIANPASSGPGRPPATVEEKAADEDAEDEQFDADDFARQLQAGMAEMLRDLESNPEMAKQFEEMMAQFGGPTPDAAAAASASASAPASTSTSTSGAGAAKSPAAAKPETKQPNISSGPNVSPEANFQDTIRRTMDRMKNSSDTASAAAANPEEDDILMNLLKEMQAGGEGADGEDGFSKMLLGMMEQLTNKEILYEPMKELDTKFDAWLAERGPNGPKKGEITAEDEKRYKEQRTIVREIVAKFESKDYNDSNAPDREYIVERMQKMQAAGAPPPELVGDMNAAQEMLGDLDTGCPQQ